MRFKDYLYNDLTFKVSSPNNFTLSELNSIKELIISEGQVSSSGLLNRIKRAKLLCVAIDNDKIIAISAIKIPDRAYHVSCFEKADVPELYKYYPYEMGWKVVLPLYRGKNLGSKLSNMLFKNIDKDKIFATVRSNNKASIIPLERMGFKPTGKPYYGSTGNEIILFTTGKK